MRLRYLGGGWIADVPARDLSEAEVEQHGADRLLASGLYAPDVDAQPVQAPAIEPDWESEEVEDDGRF